MAEQKRVDSKAAGSLKPVTSGSPLMVQWIYRCLFNIGLLASFPYYFRRMTRRGGWKDRVGQRFGKYDVDFIDSCRQGKYIWIHAVSVGEVHLYLSLVKRLQEKLSDCKIIVSATTTTGMGEWKKKLPPDVETCFYPIDRRPWVRRAMEVIQPKAIILSEAEVWPNFLWEARQRDIPVFLVNARISEKSFNRYKKIGFLFRPLFQSFSRVGTQNKSDADRLKELGCDEERIRVTGNMKFDAALQGIGKPVLDVRQLFKDTGMTDSSLVILGSSTHPGEEVILGQIYTDLKPKFPSLKLVIVPRHFERARAAGQDLKSAGVSVSYRSEWKKENPGEKPHHPDCLIVDSTGELASLYAYVDLVFIGKSLCARGGQSPIEAAAAGKAMVMGPNMQNFKAVTRTFLAQKAAIQVSYQDSLKSAIEGLLEDENSRLELGVKAREVVNQNLGAVERSLEMLTSHRAFSRFCSQS